MDELLRQKILLFLRSLLADRGYQGSPEFPDPELPEEIQQIVALFQKGDLTSRDAFVAIADSIR